MNDQDWEQWFDYISYRIYEEEQELEEAELYAARLLGGCGDE